MDPIILGRMRFAANILVHILFPTIINALGRVLCFDRIRDSALMDACQFWVKVFALSFAPRRGLRCHHVLPVRH